MQNYYFHKSENKIDFGQKWTKIYINYRYKRKRNNNNKKKTSKLLEITNRIFIILEISRISNLSGKYLKV